MRVVDTSIWIEWLIDSPLKQAIAEAFPETVQCIVPTIVQLELDKWLMREASESETDQVIAYTQNCVVAVLDTNIALQAADLHRQYKLATADAIIYATTLVYGADLLTCDAHFEGLPDVVFIRKA
jgi:predicted nucleic acid-binding protein